MPLLVSGTNACSDVDANICTASPKFDTGPSSHTSPANSGTHALQDAGAQGRGDSHNLAGVGAGAHDAQADLRAGLDPDLLVPGDEGRLIQLAVLEVLRDEVAGDEDLEGAGFGEEAHLQEGLRSHGLRLSRVEVWGRLPPDMVTPRALTLVLAFKAEKRTVSFGWQSGPGELVPSAL